MLANLFGKGFWFGVIWLLLAGGGLFMLTPLEQAGTSAWVAIVLLPVGWHVINSFFVCSQQKVQEETHLVHQEESALLAEFARLVEELGRQGNVQFVAIREETDRVQRLLADAIANLSQAFTGMHANTESQRQLVLSATGAGNEGDSQQRFDDFVENTSSVMQRVVDSVVNNSKLGMELVELTDGIAQRTRDVQGILSEIGAIAKQTNLLALNAAIEAARAGEAGRGFAVVADEVRDLSGRTTQFSQQISRLMQSMQDSVRQTEQTIEQLASQDMTFALESKAQVESILHDLDEHNQARTAAISQLGSGADDMSGRVNQAIVALQFQDMVSQLIGHVRNRVEALDGVLQDVATLGDALRADARSGNANAAIADLRGRTQAIDQRLKSLTSDTINNPVSQHAITQGDIELF